MTKHSSRSSFLTKACLGLSLALAGGMAWAQQGASAPAATVAEPAPVGGPAVIRRPTASQYRATIADVFAPAGTSAMGAVFAKSVGAIDILSAGPQVIARGMRSTFGVGAALIFVALALSLRRPRSSWDVKVRLAK